MRGKRDQDSVPFVRDTDVSFVRRATLHLLAQTDRRYEIRLETVRSVDKHRSSQDIRVQGGFGEASHGKVRESREHFVEQVHASNEHEREQIQSELQTERRSEPVQGQHVDAELPLEVFGLHR